jgi:hypothetical protein
VKKEKNKMQQMERFRTRGKRKETDTVDASGRLKNHVGYATAFQKLEQLEGELATHRKQREFLRARACRESENVRRYIASGVVPWAFSYTGEEDVAVLARMTIRSGAIPQDALDDRGRFIPDYFEPDEEKACVTYDAERRAVEILEVAVGIQKKTVITAKNQAIQDICLSLKPQYDPIATKVAEALLNLGAALEEERAFSHQLMAEDAELAQGLRPRPFFPVGILSSPDLYAWTSECIAEGIIDPADPRANALGAASKATA